MAKNLPIVPSAEPGTLAEVSPAHTWRLYYPQVVDHEKVDPIVTLFCPDGAITMEAGRTQINLKLCKGCGICAVESEGIEMKPEYDGPRGIYGAKEENK